MVKCTFRRSVVLDASEIDIKKDAKIYFYAGFNVWEQESDTQRLTGAVSDRIELQLAEIVEEEEP